MRKRMKVVDKKNTEGVRRADNAPAALCVWVKDERRSEVRGTLGERRQRRENMNNYSEVQVSRYNKDCARRNTIPHNFV